MLLLLILEEDGGCISIYVDAQELELVQRSDSGYINSLLGYLPEIARVKPVQLFKQLSSLNCGPLVTAAVWSCDSEHHPLLPELVERFRQLQ